MKPRRVRLAGMGDLEEGEHLGGDGGGSGPGTALLAEEKQGAGVGGGGDDEDEAVCVGDAVAMAAGGRASFGERVFKVECAGGAGGGGLAEAGEDDGCVGLGEGSLSAPAIYH